MMMRNKIIFSLIVMGGSGRAKATFGNDVVDIVAGNSGGWIDFRYGASSSTNMGSSAMSINGSDGNVGIGTSIPSALLHVNGTGALLNVSSGSTVGLFVNSSNVGVGTATPATSLDVMGTQGSVAFRVKGVGATG